MTETPTWWNCGYENAAGAKFCANCGKPQKPSCPECGAEVAEGAKFCANCGIPLGARAGTTVDSGSVLTAEARKCKPQTAEATSPAERLAEWLMPMLPDAAMVQVRLQGPQTPWPHLHLTAVDEHRRNLPVARAKALTIARCIIRSFPNAGWAESRKVFDLRTATLHESDAR